MSGLLETVPTGGPTQLDVSSANFFPKAAFSQQDKPVESFRVVLAVALDQFIDLTPVALRLRGVAMDLAREHSAALDVVTVESPDCEVTGLESTEEKLARYVEPLRSARVRICSHLLFGEPGEQIRKFVDKADTGYLVISSHTTPRARGGSVRSTAGELLKNQCR